ncbi:MAG: hypothetical protein ACRERV_05285 [Methylococcales bacterium]
MIDLTDISGLFSTVLFLTTVASLPFPFNRLSGAGRCMLLVLFVCLGLVPFGPVSAAVYVRSFVGDLSLTSLTVLFLTLNGHVFKLNSPERRKMDQFCVFLLPLALLFYPLAMGLGKYDPYSLGFGSPYLLGIVFLITLITWAGNHSSISISLSLAVFCYSIGWYESNNLWDYLIDPMLTIYALGVSVNRYRLRFDSRLRRTIAATVNE